MSRRTRLVAPALAVTLAAGLVAGGAAPAATKAKPKSHKLDNTVTIPNVALAPGSPILEVGRDARADGTEAVDIIRTTVNGTTLTSKITEYDGKGTYKVTVVQTATNNPDGSTTYAGTGKVTGGTGRYKGATGSFTVTGSQAKDALVAVYKIKGSLKY
jgi:hypothetical protein